MLPKKIGDTLVIAKEIPSAVQWEFDKLSDELDALDASREGGAAGNAGYQKHISEQMRKVADKRTAILKKYPKILPSK
jgi:hypothetical protein